MFMLLSPLSYVQSTRIYETLDKCSQESILYVKARIILTEFLIHAG